MEGLWPPYAGERGIRPPRQWQQCAAGVWLRRTRGGNVSLPSREGLHVVPNPLVWEVVSVCQLDTHALYTPLIT